MASSSKGSLAVLKVPETSVRHRIEYPYSVLFDALAGNSNEPSRDIIAEELQLRAEYFVKCTNPYPSPSKASRDKVKSGKLSLPLEGDFELDSVQISDTLTLSDEFGIDEVEIFVLYRALIFSYGERVKGDMKDALFSPDELLNVFADFYFQERLAIVRIVTILACVRSDPEELRHGIADVALSTIAPDPTGLVEALLAQIEVDSGPNPPSFAKTTSKRSSKYAKQVLREQICQLELVFWLLWTWNQATPLPVLSVIKTACNTNLGAKQHLANLLLDDEGARLQRHFDILWTLITITAFDLDHLTTPGNIVLSDTPSPAYFDPKQVQELSDMILPNVADPQYTCLIMIWAIVLDQLGKAALAAGTSLPSTYNSFLTTIIPDFDLASSRRSESMALLLAHRAFSFDLVPHLKATLATSPLFHDHLALESPTVQPTPIVHRAAIKTFIIGITKVFRVEYLPNIDSFIDLWVELFGAGSTNTSTVISLQFWQYDFPTPSGRALFDLTRTRFPVLVRPLVKLLRSMTGLGLSDLGLPLSQLADENVEISRGECLKNVTTFMGKLSTYTMVLQQSGPMGFRTLWEVENDAYGETVYVNLKPFLLPGGSILPAKSHGKLISGGSGRPLIVRWEHEHSGWNLLLEILAGYIANRRDISGAGTTARIRVVEQASSTVVTKKHLKPVQFTLESIGMEQDDLEGQELLVTEILDLFHSVLKHRELSIVGEFLMFVEAQGLPQIGEGSAGYGMDLVQLTVQILEDALLRASQRHGSEHCTQLVISAISTLSTLVNVTPGPTWFLLRSSKLFGSNQKGGYSSQGSSSVVLAAERTTGSYNVTIAILNLIRSLFDDAVRGCLSDRPHEVPAKEEVLLRAVRFMHVEIWVEFAGWKFANLTERFEIGKTIANLYHEILVNCTTPPAHAPGKYEWIFPALLNFVQDVFLVNASTSTIGPLVHLIAAGREMANSLQRADRAYQRKTLISLLEADLKLVYALLNVKRSSPVFSPNLSLLEQALCTGAGIAGASHSLSSKRFKQVPVSTLAEYVRDRALGFFIPVIAAELLSSLSLSLSVVQNPATPPSLVSHLTDPEATAEFLVRILRHSYETTELRNAVWGFVATAVESQAAFANLFVSGSFRSLPSKIESEEKGRSDKKETGKEKATEKEKESFQLTARKNALEAAMETTDTWKELWVNEPILLAAIVRFLNVVWHHAMEHTAVLDSIRKDKSFWELISWIITQPLGDSPAPPIVEDHFAMDMDAPKFSSDPNEMLGYTVAVATFSYQAAVKAYLVEILALDLALEPTATRDKSVSAGIVKTLLGNTKCLDSLLPEALHSSFDPRAQEHLTRGITTHFPLFRLESIQTLRPPTQRYYGDNYLFPCEALEQRLVLYLPDPRLGEVALDLVCQLHVLNCNWSLTDAQIMLTRSWKRLLQESRTLGDDELRHGLISLAPLVSEIIAKEGRSGGGTIMKVVHGERLGVLLAQLETAWLLPFTEKTLTKQFVDLLRNVHVIIMSETFRPIESLRSSDDASFHRTVMHLACFCARKARSLVQESQYLSAEQRSVVSSTMLAVLSVVVDGLREAFDRARGAIDLELDKDMELLVAVFEQCSRSELHTSSYGWLARCQEAGLVRASLDLLSQVDIGGTEMSPELLRSLRRPLYAKHILGLHLSLACSPSAAEMLVHEGALVCYSNNSVTSIVSSGSMRLAHPELAGERNPGHTAWCTILTIVAGLVGSVTSATHFIDSEITGFIQLYGAQLSRALEWNVGMPLSSASLDELEQTLALFYSIALRVNLRSSADAHAVSLLKSFSIKALDLIQHWSYVLSHPNHLASLFEGVISDERRLLDKELHSAVTTTVGIGGAGQFGAATELLEGDKRGFTASLVMRMHVICRDLVSTLVIASGGDEMLIQEPEDWPSDPQAAPVTNVVLGAATVGTFIELGNSLVEVLQYVSKKNYPGPSLPLSVAVNVPPFEIDGEVAILRQALEMVAIYATTQLAMWHYQQTLAADFIMEEDVRVGTEWNDAEYGVSLERIRVPSGAIGAEVVNELQAMLKNIKKALDGSQDAKQKNKNIVVAVENLLESRVLR